MKKYQDIFMKTGCLSEEMLMKYASGRLFSAERHEIEKHLIDCAMCSDAVEGLNMIADKKRVSEITLKLNQKIHSRVEKSEVKIIFFRKYRTQLAIAASIVVILGMVWFFRNNMSMNEHGTVSSDKIVADKFEPNHAEKEVKDVSPVTELLPPTGPATEKLTEENSNTNLKEKASGKIKNDGKKHTSVSSRFLKEEPKNKEMISQPAVIQETEGIQSVASQSQDAAALNKSDNASKQFVRGKFIEYPRAQSGAKSAPVANADATTGSNEETTRIDSTREKLTSRTPDAAVAVQEYNQKNYSGAAESFEKILAKDPDNYNALFYSSVSYLSTGQVDKAIANLNKILEKKHGEFYDDAQWYLSLAYIKKSDLQNARKILMELQKNPQSKYQKQAEETLKEIDK